MVSLEGTGVMGLFQRYLGLNLRLLYCAVRLSLPLKTNRTVFYPTSSHFNNWLGSKMLRLHVRVKNSPIILNVSWSYQNSSLHPRTFPIFLSSFSNDWIRTVMGRKISKLPEHMWKCVCLLIIHMLKILWKSIFGNPCFKALKVHFRDRQIYSSIFI